MHSFGFQGWATSNAGSYPTFLQHRSCYILSEYVLVGHVGQAVGGEMDVMELSRGAEDQAARHSTLVSAGKAQQGLLIQRRKWHRIWYSELSFSEENPLLYFSDKLCVTVYQLIPFWLMQE
jgi:hypothetical protein